jgi:hypothetical protein
MRYTFNDVTKDYNDLTAEEVDFIVENDPWHAAEYLNNHPLINIQHIGYIVEKAPLCAVEYLNHRLSEENLEYLAFKHPDVYEGLFI